MTASTPEAPGPAPLEASLRPDTLQTSEARYTREDVIWALQEGLDRLDSRPNRNRLSELSPDELKIEQQRILAERRLRIACDGARQLGQGGFLWENRFSGPSPLGSAIEYTQLEGMSITELCDYLHGLASQQSPDSAEHRKIRKILAIFQAKSSSYFKNHPLDNPFLADARISQEEARMIEAGILDPNDPARHEKASYRLLASRELYIPQDNAQPDTTQRPPTPTIGEQRQGSQAGTGVPGRPDGTQIPPDRTPAETLDNGDGQEQPPLLQQQRISFSLINNTLDLYRRGAHQARETLNRQAREKAGWNLLARLKKARLRIFDKFYHQQYLQRFVKAAIEHNNSYLDIDLVKKAALSVEQAAHNRTEAGDAARAKIQQLKEQGAAGIKFEGQTITQAEGVVKDLIFDSIISPLIEKYQPYVEQGTTASIPTQEWEKQLQTDLTAFVKTHLEEQPHPDQAVRKILGDAFGHDSNEYKILAQSFATDFLDMAEEAARQRQAHQYSLDQIKAVTDITLANVKDWAYSTEAHFDKRDKIIAWIQQHRPLGVFLSPTASAAIAAVGIGLSTGAFRGGAGLINKIIPGFGGAFVGFISGTLTRYREEKLNRTTQQVDVALGRLKPGGTPATLRARSEYDPYALDVATVDQLIGRGEGHEAILLDQTVTRASLPGVLAELNNGQNINYIKIPGVSDLLMRRLAEIKTRLQYSDTHKIDLISFEGEYQTEQNRLSLIQHMVLMRRAVNDAMARARLSPQEKEAILDKERTFTEQWEAKFGEIYNTQEKAFQKYRVGQALKAGVVGGATGLASATLVGLVGPIFWDFITEHTLVTAWTGALAAGTLRGASDAARAVGLVDLAQSIGPATGITRESLTALVKKPGNLQVGKDLVMAVSGRNESYGTGVYSQDLAVTFQDLNGHKLDLPPMHLADNGRLIVSLDQNTWNTRLAGIPAQVKEVIDKWGVTPTHDPDHSLREGIKRLIALGRHETFIHGNTIVDIDPSRKVMSMIDYATKTQVHGALNPDGTFTFDVDSVANRGVKWASIIDRLNKEGWALSDVQVASSDGLRHSGLRVLAPDATALTPNLPGGPPVPSGASLPPGSPSQYSSGWWDKLNSTRSWPFIPVVAHVPKRTLEAIPTGPAQGPGPGTPGQPARPDAGTPTTDSAAPQGAEQQASGQRGALSEATRQAVKDIARATPERIAQIISEWATDPNNPDVTDPSLVNQIFHGEQIPLHEIRQRVKDLARTNPEQIAEILRLWAGSARQPGTTSSGVDPALQNFRRNVNDPAMRQAAVDAVAQEMARRGLTPQGGAHETPGDNGQVREVINSLYPDSQAGKGLIFATTINGKAYRIVYASAFGLITADKFTHPQTGQEVQMEIPFSNVAVISFGSRLRGSKVVFARQGADTSHIEPKPTSQTPPNQADNRTEVAAEAGNAVAGQAASGGTPERPIPPLTDADVETLIEAAIQERLGQRKQALLAELEQLRPAIEAEIRQRLEEERKQAEARPQAQPQQQPQPADAGFIDLGTRAPRVGGRSLPGIKLPGGTVRGRGQSLANLAPAASHAPPTAPETDPGESRPIGEFKTIREMREAGYTEDEIDDYLVSMGTGIPSDREKRLLERSRVENAIKRGELKYEDFVYISDLNMRSILPDVPMEDLAIAFQDTPSEHQQRIIYNLTPEHKKQLERYQATIYSQPQTREAIQTAKENIEDYALAILGS